MVKAPTPRVQEKVVKKKKDKKPGPKLPVPKPKKKKEKKEKAVEKKPPAIETPQELERKTESVYSPVAPNSTIHRMDQSIEYSAGKQYKIVTDNRHIFQAT